MSGEASDRGRDERTDGGIPDDRVADRADYDPAYDPADPVACEVCGATMVYTAACKIRCPACGYTRDCSDP